MSAQILHAEWLHWPEIRQLAECFAKSGAELRFVGGCVRDTLLGREVQEVDAATPAMPEEVMALLAACNIRALPTGIAHGTVTALLGARSVEITTLRQDTACDGRHATVEYTHDWQADAQRRDFTINALYCTTHGELYDYTDGLKDIAARRLRFIGDAHARIHEDGLRILRYFRFCAQLSIAPDDAEALNACRAEAVMLQGLSGERIAQEMRKLLGAPALDPALLEAMEQALTVQEISLPPVPLMLRNLLALPHASSWLLRLAAWLHGQRTQSVRQRWKLGNDEHAVLRLLTQEHLPAPDMPEPAQKKLLRRLGKARFTDVVLLAWAAHDSAERYSAMLRLAEQWEVPIFPVNGTDLLARGFTPGAALGATLKQLEAQWEAEHYTPSKEELLARL